MRRIARSWAVALLALGAIGAAGAQEFIGPNLIENPNFEEVEEGNQFAGWTWSFNPAEAGTVSADREVFLVGGVSLRMEVPGEGGGSLRAATVAVEEGRQYLVSVAFRSEGFGEPGKYSGVSAYVSLDWVDAEGGLVARMPGMGFPYHASEWDLRDQFVKAPPGAAGAVLGVGLGNSSEKQTGTNIPSTLWVEAVQLRPYTPPATPEWAESGPQLMVEGGVETARVKWYQLAGERMAGGAWSSIVRDEEATFGTAVASPEGSGQGIMAHSAYFDQVTPGLYRLILRCKVADNTRAEQAGGIDVHSQYASGRGMLELWPKDFAEADEYQEFTLDYVIRSPGWWGFRVFTEGNQVFTADTVRLFPVALFDDRQLLDLYPGSEGSVAEGLRPHRGWPLRALAVAGPLYDYYRLTDALHLGSYHAEISVVWVEKGRNQSFKGFPETAEELFRHSLVVLCGVNVGDMTLRQKHMLAEYVRRGGGLLMLGGHKAFERGGVAGSLLEEVLPVRVAEGELPPLVHVPAGLRLEKAEGHPTTEYVDLGAGPVCFYAHDLAPREGAQVILRAGERPGIIVGTAGAGRVTCVGLTCFGKPAAGQTAFWEWPGWVILLRDLCWWTAAEDERF